MKKLSKEDLQKVQDDIMRAVKGEDFVRFLDQCMIARQYSYGYSFGNLMLANFDLYIRKGYGITMLASFNSWSKEMGRKIKKGERGLNILAPIIKKLPVYEYVEDSKGNETEKIVAWESTCVGFKFVKVFDYSQTEARDKNSFVLPELETCKLKDTGEYDWVQTIMQDAAKNKIKVVFGKTGVANGFSDGESITLKKGNTPLQQFKTYLHERVHYMLHFNDDRVKVSSEKLTMNREIEAETATYFLLKQLGFSESELQGQINYLASWTYAKDFEMSDYFSNVQKALKEIKVELVEKKLAVAV